MIQRHNLEDNSVSFNKTWKEYVEGFGNLEGNFWYGLKSIHCLTQNQPWQMRINYNSKSNGWHDFIHDWFSVGTASEGYPLSIGGKFIGDDDSNWFVKHPLNKMKFSTPDNDKDQSSGNCAAQWKSGWWYNNCSSININTHQPYIGKHNDIVYTEMMIRPKGCFPI